MYIDIFQNSLEFICQMMVERNQIDSIQIFYNFNLTVFQKGNWGAIGCPYHQDKMSNVSNLVTPKPGQFGVQIYAGIGLFWDLEFNQVDSPLIYPNCPI